MTTEITIENADNVLREIESAFFDIPFENSKFQTESFVIAGEITPERAYRSIGLRMMSKIRDITEALYNRKERQIDIDELNYKLNNKDLDQFEKRRLELKLEKLLSGDTWGKKLLNDAVQELNVLYTHFKAMPRFTREQFEAGERTHYEQRLLRQVIGVDGAKASLINMNEDYSAIKKFEGEYNNMLTTNNVNMLELSKLVTEQANFIKNKDKQCSIPK